MSREYDQLAWVDYPETLTPISAANLNRMENGIANLYTDRNKMENNIAYVEEGETATRHYFINSYLMLNGIFYKTTSEINVGDILDPTLAGNIEHVDVSSQFGSGGGGSTGCVELTQAQYDALSEEAKMLDVIYLITDSPDNYLDEVFGDFASVEYTDTASKAYAVGDYLMFNSKFYTVTDDIAQGDTLVPDTNIERTTVSEWLLSAENIAKLNRLDVYPNGSLVLTGLSGIVSCIENSSYRVGLHVGVGGTNHGVYHWGPNLSDMGWMIYSDASGNIYINNSPVFPTGSMTYMCGGYISTGNSRMFFSIPYPHAASSGRNITITGIVARQGGSYLLGSGDGPTASFGTVTYNRTELGFDVVISRSNPTYGGTNNDTVGLHVTFTVS